VSASTTAATQGCGWVGCPPPRCCCVLSVRLGRSLPRSGKPGPARTGEWGFKSVGGLEPISDALGGGGPAGGVTGGTSRSPAWRPVLADPPILMALLQLAHAASWMSWADAIGALPLAGQTVMRLQAAVPPGVRGGHGTADGGCRHGAPRCRAPAWASGSSHAFGRPFPRSTKAPDWERSHAIPHPGRVRSPAGASRPSRWKPNPTDRCAGAGVPKPPESPGPVPGVTGRCLRRRG
jgi:hypothetical protein